jgi:hypothetical protein
MSSTTTERNRTRFTPRRRDRRGAPRTQVRPAFDRTPRTLEDLISIAAERMERATPADCPVCGRPELTPAGCAACGSQLS